MTNIILSENIGIKLNLMILALQVPNHHRNHQNHQNHPHHHNYQSLMNKHRLSLLRDHRVFLKRLTLNLDWGIK